MSSVNTTVLNAIEQHLKKSNEELIQCTTMKIAAGKKTEERFIALAKPCKIYTFVMVPRFKIVTSNHLLDLLELRSTTLNELAFKFKNSQIHGESDFPDDLLNAIVAEAERVFPGNGRTLFGLEVNPPDRIVEQSSVDPEEVPCGGFANVYSAFASYNNVGSRADLMWHIENVSLKQSSKVLDLREFEGLTAHDLQSIFMALKTNTYFNRLVLSDIVFGNKYEKNAPHIEALMDVFRMNTTLCYLDMRGCIPKSAAGDFWPAMFNALSSNKKIPLTSIDLSENVFDAGGITAFSHWLQTMPSGLCELRLVNCGLDKKSLIPICNGMKAHPKIRSTLFVLDMSCNKWDAESISALASMFTTPTMISEMLLHDTQAPLDGLLGALVRGCLELRVLDVSASHITQRGASQLCQWAKASSQLKRINVSSTEMPPDSFAELIISIGQNPYLTDVVVKASQLHVGAAHAPHLAVAMSKAPNLAALDVAGNELGEDGVSALCSSIVGLGAQSSMKRLNLSGNLSSTSKEKDQRRNNPKATAAIMALLNSEVPLEALSLRGGRSTGTQPSPADCTDIIYTLACKEAKLQELDLMGCGMGNRGAVALGQMLQVNKSLRKLTWDHNNVSVSGYRAFVRGLECNRTLKVMPLPVKDLEAAMSASNTPEANAITQRIQAAIANIQNPQKLDTSVSFGATGIVTQDGRQDVLEKEVANLRRLGGQSDAARSMLEEPDAQTLLDDCTRFQQMGSSFQFMREEVAGLLEQEMVTKLQTLSKEFTMIVASMKSQLAGKMGDFIAQTFKTIDRETANRLRIAIDYGTKTFDHVSLDKILVAAAGQEIQTGASECFNSAVDLAMDYVYDKLLDGLKSTAVTLKSAQVTASMSDGTEAAVAAAAAAPATPRHDKKDKKEEKKKEKEEKKKEKEKKKEEKKEKKEKKKEEPKEEEPKEEEQEEPKEEEAAATPTTATPTTPTSATPTAPTSAPPATPTGMTPTRRPPPVPPGGKKPPPGRLAKPNAALAAALAAGPVSPAARRPMVRKPVEEEASAAPAAAAPATPEKPAPEEKKEGHKLFAKKEKPPVVKPTKTREITYKVGNGETVLGVAVESSQEHTPALTHPTKDRARGPAGRKGGARRPPTHKNYTLTDPTAQLQPTLL